MTIDYERDRRNIENCLRQDGIEEGRTIGIEEGKLVTVQNLIRETTFDNQKIASMAEVEESIVGRARAEMIHA